jgi:putative hydrolase of the HAD superfamily
MPVRAVLFDFGNTLARPEESFRLTTECLAEMGVSVREPEVRAALEEEAAARRSVVGLETDAGKCRDFYARRSRALLARLRVGGSLEVKAQCLTTLYVARSLVRRPHEGCPEVLDRLRRRGLRLAVVSNSDGRVAERCAALGVIDYFEQVVDSALVGYAKPDPEIFGRALRMMELEPAEAVYVGDHYEHDVVAAKGAGLATVLCNADPDALPAGAAVRPDLRIASLRELDIVDGRPAAIAAAAGPGRAAG